MSGTPLVLATRSRGKLRELRAFFARSGLRVIDLDEAGIAESEEEELVEAHETFEKNAEAKARYFHRRTGGLPVVADDSGLVVAALGGRPGVWSKRWSGSTELSGESLDEANNAKLLRELLGCADRRARYVCVAVYVDGVHTRWSRGEVEGRILTEARGSGGFGYDPLFFSSELGNSFGEVGMDEKERVSHRGRAFGALIEGLRRGGHERHGLAPG